MRKLCGKCLRKREVRNFHRNYWSDDGLQFYCKECMNEKNRASKAKYKEEKNELNKEVEKLKEQFRKAFGKPFK